LAAVFSAEEIMDITGARLALGLMPDDSAEVHTDTRTLPEGAWYVALPGKKYDGHDFLGDAFSEGAIGCIVGERSGYAIASTSFPLLAVIDPLEALAKLAKHWRERVSPKVLVVMVNRSEERCPSGKLCYDDLQVKHRTEYLRLANEDVGAVLNAVLDVNEPTQLLVVEISPTSFIHTSKALSVLDPDVLLISKDGYDHFRMTCSQQEFNEGLNATFAWLNPDKCTLIMATSAQDVLIRSDEFAGKKIVHDEDDQSEDPDIWAARKACESI
jgi:UDP-N-acetylmuramoyl-tripeptide--D-alanyl-D-alanine ligase